MKRKQRLLFLTLYKRTEISQRNDQFLSIFIMVCNKFAGLNSSNLWRFLQVRIQMMSALIICTVGKEGL